MRIVGGIIGAEFRACAAKPFRMMVARDEIGRCYTPRSQFQPRASSLIRGTVPYKVRAPEESD